jgi:hypothetical protein
MSRGGVLIVRKQPIPNRRTKEPIYVSSNVLLAFSLIAFFVSAKVPLLLLVLPPQCSRQLRE